tara:strand:- start:106 stop:999 length:894 start_codon:yes stop_codon:yes gene_type:complete
MNPSITIRSSDLDPSELTYSSPRVLDSGAKMIYVNYSENQRFVVQTPWMVLPFDMSCYTQGEYPKYTMQMSFRGHEDNQSVNTWLSKLNQIDEKLISDVVGGTDSENVKYSLSWFKKAKTSEEVVKALYSPCVRRSKDRDTGEYDGKYPPTQRIKLPCRVKEDGSVNFTFPVYDKKTKEKIDLNETPLESLLKKGTRVTALIRPTSIWITGGGNFGMSWAVEQLKLIRQTRLSDYGFLDDSDDEPMEEDTSEATPMGNEVEDSDDEEEEEVEIEPPSPPTKKVKKTRKRVVRKKGGN